MTIQRKTTISGVDFALFVERPFRHREYSAIVVLEIEASRPEG